MRRTIEAALRRPVLTIGILVVLLAGAATGGAYAYSRPSGRTGDASAFPQSTAMEQRLGVRFSRIAVVGDGGLVQLNFVVLDPDKATAFEASLAKPPIIVSEDAAGYTSRISVMKQGHNLVPGQTYYLVYENTRGVVHSGGHATIVEGRLRLEHVPVF
ncbi:MAG TPA: hypothetical protein VE442_18630 [Jatrophihabitans sp.]|jgi:hypothetical protein|nr:hypothetical protein [Jatrophihabitans sp.]